MGLLVGSEDRGHLYDRDLNAAINIRRSGMDALMSDSKTMLCGGHV